MRDAEVIEMPSQSCSLSIVFCTRNRPEDLTKALRSVIALKEEVASRTVEVMIADDGSLEVELIDSFRAEVQRCEWTFTYFNKSDRGGLLKSRIESLALAAYDVVVFFDDDIEVEPGYLALLFQMMDSNPEAAGVGGVDILWRPARTWRRLYEYVICFRAIRRGRLSISGFGGDADRWIGEVEAFETQFLAGFNMAFRRDALRSLEMQDFFDGYSLGEDLYLSYVARQSGPLLVHPQLRVRHHQSALARDRSEQVFYTQLVNHYHLLRLMQSSRARCLSLVITGAGMFVRYAIKACVDAVIPSGRPDFGRMKGSWNGLKFVMTSVIRDSSRRAKA